MYVQETKDYENIDIVSPVFGEVANSLCKNSETAPITEVFTMYSDLKNSIQRRVCSLG